ncbi:PREDICTED: uncharacterized protein LOC109185656, partial [Ipomoea nil]|uniref:uncharacterized protein LOC109185656 n=1 Tax=Ipomoea nil TaxID=35883 RepID=UPI000901BE4E
MGGKIDRSVNKNGGPPIFRINGQNFHYIGSLLPVDGKKPHFAQLYIYDTNNELSNRINSVRPDGEQNGIHVEIVNDIQEVLDTCNVLVKSFRMARSELQMNPLAEVKIKLLGKRSKDARTYNLPQVSEVAALIVGDIDTNIGERDIMVETKSGLLQRISELNPAYLPMQYPLLFSYGEDGYREDIPFSTLKGNTTGRQRISPREYFAYRIMSRVSEDAMAICRLVGYPDLFITFTCNPKWPEVQRFLNDRKLKPEDRPDIICRLFKMKLDALISDCRKNKLFGPVMGVIYTIEFQKRGLPHAHILLFLDKINGTHSVEKLDHIISAELPDQEADAEYYKVVEEFMMHGPCGKARLTSPCMSNGKCTKHFPKSLLIAQLLMRMSRSIKYLFKYMNKGHDRVTAEFYRTSNDQDGPQMMIPLTTFSAGQTILQSMFLEWFEANKTYPEARNLTYAEMPTKFVWKKDIRKWQQGKEDFQSVEDACCARGLVDDDREYVHAIEEASHWATPVNLRRLFVTLLMTNSIAKPEVVWEAAWIHLSDDAQFKIRQELEFQEELAYDVNVMKEENDTLVEKLTEEQRTIYDNVLQDAENNLGGLFFVYEYGGTGKTFLWRALSSALRSKGEIVLNVASSGIASLLLPGGRTAHSRFAIPIAVNEDSTCNISQSSPLAHLIMQLVLGGDFRQILPVIPKGTRQDIVLANSEVQEIADFAKWIANIGDGTIGDSMDGESEINIPEQFLLNCGEDPIATIVDSTFPMFQSGHRDHEYLKDRAILAPTLDVVDT